MVAVQAVNGAYDLLADLVPITAVGDSSMVLMVGPRSPQSLPRLRWSAPR
jgi:hypothetical protein